MKKILTFALALLAIVSMSACSTGTVPGNNSENPGNKDVVVQDDKGQKEATIALKGFMNGFCNFDIVEMSKYCNIDMIDEVGYETLKNEMTEIYNELLGDSTARAIADELGEFINAYVDGISDSADYIINDATYEDGKWIFDISFECLSLSSLGEICNEEMESLVEELEIKYADDLNNVEDEEDEEALMIELYSELFTEMKDVINDACAKAETGTADGTLVVIKGEDGKWVVDGNSGDIDSFVTTIQ